MFLRALLKSKKAKQMFNLRPANESDLNFVAASWKQSFRKEYPKLTKDEFFEVINPKVDKIIERSDILIACDPEEPRVIYGYLVYKVVESIPVVHFAYVKQSLRRFGILKAMFKVVQDISSQTLVGTFKRSRDQWLYDKFSIIHKPNFKEI